MNVNICLVRMIAIFSVILTHVVIYFIWIMHRDYSSVSVLQTYIWQLFLSVGHWGVPLFIYISGYYYLNRKDNIEYIVRKMVKTIWVLIIWSAIYLFLKHHIPWAYDLDNSAHNIFQIITTPAMHHLWYMYLYIMILAVIIPLQSICLAVDMKHIMCLLFLWFVFDSCIPMLSEQLHVGQQFHSIINLYMGGYLFLGGITQKTKKLFSIRYLFCMLIVLIIIECGLSNWVYRQDLVNHIIRINYSFIGYLRPFNIVESYLVFLILLRVDSGKFTPMIQTVIRSFSKHSFVMYLLHMVPLTIIANYQIFNFIGYNITIQMILFCFFVIIVTYIISIIVTILYRRVLAVLR